MFLHIYIKISTQVLADYIIQYQLKEKKVIEKQNKKYQQ